MRQLVSLRRLIEDEELDPNNVFIDPEDVVEIEDDEDEDEDEGE